MKCTTWHYKATADKMNRRHKNRLLLGDVPHYSFYSFVLYFPTFWEKKELSLCLHFCVTFVIKIERATIVIEWVHFGIFTLCGSIFSNGYVLNMCHMKGFDSSFFSSSALSRWQSNSEFQFGYTGRWNGSWLEHSHDMYDRTCANIIWTYGVKMYFKRFQVAHHLNLFVQANNTHGNVYAQLKRWEQVEQRKNDTEPPMRISHTMLYACDRWFVFLLIFYAIFY